MKKTLCLFTLFCGLFCFSATAAVFDAKETYLENGLRVIAVQNNKAPIAQMMLWYNVGSVDEKVGKAGLAHLLEHLMFRGTANVPASDFKNIMLRNGVDFNAFTSHDFTVYHELLDISRLELAMALEADRMQNLKIDDKAFRGEQKVVYQERQQRIENEDKTRFMEEADQILWKGSAYDHPVSGTLSEIRNLTKQDALDFYHNFYAPNNAVLVVVGDVSFEDVEKLSQKYFGKLKRNPDIKRQTFNASFEKGDYLIKRQSPHIKSTKIVRHYLLPSILEDKKGTFALELFSSYFGESGDSYLKKNVVKKQKAVSASSFLSPSDRLGNTFSISFIPTEQISVEQSIILMDKAMEDALKSFTLKTLENEKKKALSWLVYIKDSLSSTANILGYMASLGFSKEEIENYTTDINNISIEDVKVAVQNMLENARRVTVVLSPAMEKMHE